MPPHNHHQPHSNDPELATALHALRQSRQITQRQMAARAGVSYWFICELEAGRRGQHSRAKIEALCEWWPSLGKFIELPGERKKR